MTGPEIAAVVLAVVAVAEAVGLVTLWVLFTRARGEADELRARVDTRNMLLSGGREAVKHVWQTANLVREKGFGGAITSSIESTSTYDRGWVNPSLRGASPPPEIPFGAAHMG